jgi:hypothetical protein
MKIDRLDHNVKKDGGGAIGASLLAASYGIDLPPWLFKKLYSFVQRRNEYLKNHPEHDHRIHDIRQYKKGEHKNQGFFQF